MAKLTEPTFKANKIGQREALADLISQVDAKETPFTSMVKKAAKPGNTFFQWQVESLPTPRLGGVLDGKDVDPNGAEVQNFTVDNGVQYRHQIGTYIQKFRRVVRVSDLAEDLNTVAGVKSPLAREVARAVQLIKRDMEITFCSDQKHQEDQGVVGGVEKPYLTRGLDMWLKSAAVPGGGGAAVHPDTNAGSGVYTVPTQYCVPSASRATGSVADLTEAKIQNVMTSIYEQTGQTRQFDAVVGTALKRAFTNLVFNTPAAAQDTTRAAVRTLNREAKDSTYISNIDVFKGDFGGLRLHTSTWLKWDNNAPNQNVGYIIPFDMLDVRYGGNVAGVYDLTNNGGGEGRRIEAIAALCVYNPLAFGVLDFTA